MKKKFITISAVFFLVLFGKILEAQTTFVDGVTGGTMVLVQGGTFDMGSNDGYDDEQPVHRVTLSDFYIGETEVTQAQWRAVMGDYPSNHRHCDDCPVEQVSWDDVRTFLAALNASSGGTRYRLPTEAEWEYAARGGAKSQGYTYAGSENPDGVAWYRDNSGEQTWSVKGKLANELGLYDMTGNVSEWCADLYGAYPSGSVSNPTGPEFSGEFNPMSSTRVVRGGSWVQGAGRCGVSNRNFRFLDDRLDNIGFRLAASSK